MADSSYARFPLTQAVLSDLLLSLRHDRVLWSPCKGSDNVCRLQPLGERPLPNLALPTLIPLKKLLLPHREALWSYQAGEFSATAVPAPFAVLGLPLCDLQAIWYLDQLFADDAPYQSRRAQALLVGMPCEPGPDCRCSVQLMPLAGDLFLTDTQAWALSVAGEKLLQAAGCCRTEDQPLPWPEGLTAQRQSVSEEIFHAEVENPLWQEESRRCFSCGACSAVCPTCYCFDLLDEASVCGQVSRERVWDNCFFAEHGKVAGNYDFRTGRANRLRFRMEHKFYGFGALRGQNSCVGCGRCRKACPVDIDLDQIAARLAGEVRP